MNPATNLLAQTYSSYSPGVQFANSFFAIFFPILFIVVVISVVSNWMIFRKAGQPGWASIIPFYNIIIILRIIGKPAWWLLVMIVAGFIPVVGGLFNLAVGVYFCYLLAKSFGKDVGFTVGMVFLPFIFYPILAFGKAQYVGPAGAPSSSSPAPMPPTPPVSTMAH